MYGTIARMHIRPGADQEFQRQLSAYESLNVPGFVSTSMYRTDADPTVFYMVVAFESKDAYLANARSPEQDARFKEMRALLASDPEWHDGEIVGSVTQ